MVDKQPGPVFSFVEKAYIRLQAGDVLTQCMEVGTAAPMHEMIQEMVFAGPQSLGALREILGEAMGRKTQLYDDLNQVTNQLTSALQSDGVVLNKQDNNQAIQELSEIQLLSLMREQGIDNAATQSACLQVLRDSQELFANLLIKIRLLEQIEAYLQDWLLGLTYQSIHQGSGEEQATESKDELL